MARGTVRMLVKQLAHGKGSPDMFPQAKPVHMASSLGKRMNSLAFWNSLKLNQKLQARLHGDCLADSER